MAFKSYSHRPSPSEWLADAEAHFAHRLRGASLVVEANFDRTDITTALSALGYQYRQCRNEGISPQRLWRRYPGITLVALAGAGAVLSIPGTYWPPVLEQMGLPNRQDQQYFWGTGFLEHLRKFELAEFPELPLRFVGPILLHGGIPNGSLGDLVELLMARRTLDPGLTVASFLSWAFTPGMGSRLQPLDKPVQYFLENGDEFALDVVERLLEVVDYLVDNPDDAAPGVLTSDTTGVPAVMLSKLCQLIRDGDVDLKPAHRSASSTGRSSVETPRIALDIEQQCVSVELPAVRDCGGHVSWTIFADGRRRTVESQATWVGPDEPAPATNFPVPGPVRQIQVSNSAQAAETELALVDAADPLLLFDSSGAFLPPRLPIPRGTVWALLPQAEQLVDERGDAVRTLVEDVEPTGWTKWRLVPVDTTSVRAIRLPSASSRPPRRVRQDQLPEIRLGAPLECVRASNGQPVYCGRPIVALPADGHTDIVWTIEVHRDGSSEPIVPARTVTSRDAQHLDVFDGVEAPLLGVYMISVRGPLGRRVSARVGMAEGLAASCDPPLRRITGTSIEPATATLTNTRGLSVEESRIEFGSQQLRRPVQVTDPCGHTAVLTVEPPHMGTLVETAESRGQWSPSRARVTTDQFGIGSALLVRVPGHAPEVALEFHYDGEFRQRQPPSRSQGPDVARFDLAKFSDTVRDTGRGELSVVVDGIRTQVAIVRPPVYAAAAEGFGSHIQLIDFNAAPDLKAALYACTAPWLGPTVCEISDAGTIAVPGKLTNAGRLLVQIAEDDPWIGVEWPSWPIDTALVCERLGWYHTTDSAAQILVQLLDPSVTSLPTGMLAEANDMLWKALAALSHLGLSDRRRHQVADEFAAVIARNPDVGWQSLVDANLPADRTCELAIESGLVEYATDRHSDVDAVGALWVRSPMAAALLAMTNLVEPVDRNIADIAELELGIQTTLGPVARMISDGATDPYREVGKFDASAAWLDKKRPAEIEAAWRAAQVVPSGMLESDSRATAARALFDQRHSKALADVFAQLPGELRWMRQEIRDYGNPMVKAQLDARFETGSNPQPWQFLPALSFAYAACARFRAWFPSRLSPMRLGNRKIWRAIARAAPGMIQMNIVLADLLISAPFRRRVGVLAPQAPQSEVPLETTT